MTEHTHEGGRLRRALSRLTRAGDVPVVVMLAWAGWLAVPWSFSGLAQARAAAAAAADPSRLAEAAQESSAFGTTPPALLSHGAADPTALTPHPNLISYGGASNALSGTSTLTAGSERTFGEAQVSEAVREMIALERARIAGEVHDAAGHGLAAIAMQAGVALLMLEENPAQARASLEAIRTTSTEALSRLRTALDTMDPSSTPESGEDLARLIDGVRAAGLRVDLEPASPNVPAHLKGTVYRVVRESLTNVLRHAGTTTALVRVANDPCAFVLEVADQGTPWPPTPGPRPTPDTRGMREGRGVAGMRAHVTAAGGDFSAGPGDGGGFRVVARFPQSATTPATDA